MDTEQAINFMDAVQNQLREINGCTYEAVDYIKAALREKAEREKGCFWCLDVSLNDVRINEVRVNINCCPMCGRRLEVEHEN